jgi:hypothetical protein
MYSQFLIIPIYHLFIELLQSIHHFSDFELDLLFFFL